MSAEPRSTPSGRWQRVTITVVFGVFYAYLLSEALTNLVQLPPQWPEIAVTGAPVPWAALVGSVLVPPVAFVAAALVARPMPNGRLVLVHLAGLAAANALFLTAIAIVWRIQTS